MNKQGLLEKLKQQDIPEEIILAFDKVKREAFIPDHLVAYSYEDMPMPLADGSTVSQPSTIAFMLKLLELKQNQKVLEIGSGSGYVLELISEIIKNGKIYGMERNKMLAIKSKRALEKDSNVSVLSRSGYNGLPEKSPFDRIIASAAYPEMPESLIEQLRDPGIMVIPVKQSIFQIRKENQIITQKEFPGFVFVQMIPDQEKLS